MYTLVYKSRTYLTFDETDLEEIFEVAYLKNRQHKVTGCLYYSIPHVIQLLQGEEKSVQQLYKNILKDKRHHSVSTLISEDYPTLLFPDWGLTRVVLTERQTDVHNKFLSIIANPQAENLIRDLVWIHFNTG